MAKIYETNEDLDRERLSREVSAANDSKTIGSILFGIGIPLLLWGFSRTPAAEAPKLSQGFWRQVWEKLKAGPSNRLLGTIAMVVGVAELWGASRQARCAEEKLRELGPEKIVLPQPLERTDANPAIDDRTHAARLQHTRNSSAKSL